MVNREEDGYSSENSWRCGIAGQVWVKRLGGTNQWRRPGDEAPFSNLISDHQISKIKSIKYNAIVLTFSI